MLQTGKRLTALARAIALCQPQVIPIYPKALASPIIAGLRDLACAGGLKPCEVVSTEGERDALSAAIAAAARGARAYLPVANSDLHFMAEGIYNAAGLGLPIVMTLINGSADAAGNDHSDVMALRESGWIQLFAETRQQAIDLHVVAFRLAETLSVPTLVSLDARLVAEDGERLDVPAELAAFLPPASPPPPPAGAAPTSIRALAGPEAFTELRYLQFYEQRQALVAIERLADEFRNLFDRAPGGLLSCYRTDDAELIVVALGVLCSEIRAVVDAMRAEGAPIGLVGLTTFRPFPADALAAALERAAHVLTIDRALDVGVGGPLAANVAVSLAALPRPPRAHSAIAGLGGRPIAIASLRRLIDDVTLQPWQGVHFLDLNERLVGREIHRRSKSARPGPTAQAILRQLEIERAARQGK